MLPEGDEVTTAANTIIEALVDRSGLEQRKCCIDANYNIISNVESLTLDDNQAVYLLIQHLPYKGKVLFMGRKRRVYRAK